MNHTGLLPHILLGFKTRCVCTGAAGAAKKAQEDITCRFSCIRTTYNPPFNPLLPEAQKSAFCLILPVFAAPNSSCQANFPKPAVSRPPSSRLAPDGLRRFFQPPLPAARPPATLPLPTRPPTGTLLLREVRTLLLPPIRGANPGPLRGAGSPLPCRPYGAPPTSAGWCGRCAGGRRPACGSGSPGPPPANPPLSAGWAGQGDERASRLCADLAHPEKQEVGDGQRGRERRAERVRRLGVNPATRKARVLGSSSFVPFGGQS